MSTYMLEKEIILWHGAGTQLQILCGQKPQFKVYTEV